MASEKQSESSLINLKRKIVAIDKLVKHKNKTDTRLTELTKCLVDKDKIIEERNKVIEEKNEEIVKLKAELCQSLVSSQSENNEELQIKLVESNKLVNESYTQIANLKKDVASKASKMRQLETDNVKYKSKYLALEKDLKSKHENIIKRELESQDLKQQIENLQRKYSELENGIKSGKQFEEIKETYDKVKWENLAEISALKQEKFKFEKLVEELKQSNDVLVKSKADLEKQLENHSKDVKLNESFHFEKTIEKKDKSLASLEKKLAQALEKNERLKVQLKNKSPKLAVSKSQIYVHREECDEAYMDEQNAESKDSDFTPKMLFSFSKPNARFVIGRPSVPSKSKFKLIYICKGSFRENLPSKFNVSPKISDHFEQLSSTCNKRKQVYDEFQRFNHKKLKTEFEDHVLENMDNLEEALDDDNMELSGQSQNIKLNPPSHKGATSKKRPKEKSPCKTLTENETTNFVTPNPVKSRKAPSGEDGKEKQQKLSLPKFTLPAQLSPIKSPKVELQSSPPSSSSASLSSGSARERLMASVSMAPVQVSAPVRNVGGKLSAAQLEAAKRRAAAPAPAATLAPSVDGFRQSSVKNNSKKPPPVNKKPVKIDEELLYCPTRRRTNPIKVMNEEVSSQIENSKKADSKELQNTKITEKIDETEVIICPIEELENCDDTHKEILVSDLDVSDSDEEDKVIVKYNVTESDDEDDVKEERFNKLKSKMESNIPINEEPSIIENRVAPESNNKNKVFFQTLLEEIVYNYKLRSEEMFKILQSERDKLSRERSDLMYEATVECLRKHFRNLMGSQNEASFEKLVSSISSTNNPQSEAMICDLVYEYLKSEHKDTALLNASDENQPPITRKQQRLFALLTVLSKQERYKNIIDRMIKLLWHNMFGRDRMYNLKLNAVQNCGRMFALCARFNDDINIARHFIYDLFYFKSPRNHILIGIIAALWPEVFPHYGSEMSKSPLLETIVWCVFNTGPEIFSPEMRVDETKLNFEKDYGFKANQVKAESLVITFIKSAEEDVTNRNLLEEITKSLLLIGRCKEYRWVNNNILTRLMKSLQSIFESSAGISGNQEYLSWVISTIGLLSRVYPADGRDNIKPIYQSVESLLRGDSLTEQSEDACLQALLHLGYHLQTQVAQFLKIWKPKHYLKPKTKQLLEDFLGTRGKKYAQITAGVVHAERTRARKKKGLKKRSGEIYV